MEKQAGGSFSPEEEWGEACAGMQAGSFQARKKRSYSSRGSASPACNIAEGSYVTAQSVVGGMMCPRDRLQRHRLQVAGTVRIPDGWCGEGRLREWVSSQDLEDALQPPGLFSARAALIAACSSPGFVSPVSPC